MMRKSIGGKELKPTSLRRGTKILSSSILKLLKGVNKTQFWESVMSKVGGVIKRKTLPRQLLTILRIFTQQPIQHELKK